MVGTMRDLYLEFWYDYAKTMRDIKKEITKMKRTIKILQKPCKSLLTRVRAFAKTYRCRKARHEPYALYKNIDIRKKKQQNDIDRYTKGRIDHEKMKLGGYYQAESFCKSVKKEQKELLKQAKKFKVDPYKNGKLKTDIVLKSQITRAKNK